MAFAVHDVEGPPIPDETRKVLAAICGVEPGAFLGLAAGPGFLAVQYLADGEVIEQQFLAAAKQAIGELKTQ